jgi:hypothetical protein
MEPRAAMSGFFGWFALEENQKFSKNYSMKDGYGGVLGEPAARRLSACKTTPLERAGAAEEEQAGRWEGEADR